MTHEESVAQHAKRVIRMKDGRIFTDMTAEEDQARQTRIDRRAREGDEMKPVLTILKTILGIFLAFFRLFYQSIYLALGQIWVNKTRSVLTTLGIVIGVASVTAVIAALTGLKAKILTQVETLGTNTIFISPRVPDTGRNRHAGWWQMRFRPEQMDGLLEHCPSVAALSRVGGVGWRTVKYGEQSVDRVESRALSRTSIRSSIGPSFWAASSPRSMTCRSARSA